MTASCPPKKIHWERLQRHRGNADMQLSPSHLGQTTQWAGHYTLLQKKGHESPSRVNDMRPQKRIWWCLIMKEPDDGGVLLSPREGFLPQKVFCVKKETKTWPQLHLWDKNTQHGAANPCRLISLLLQQKSQSEENLKP